MAWRITENLHQPIALMGWIVFLAKPIWRMIEFLDDIDFVTELLGGGDRVTQGWVSAGVEFLDTGWGTLAMSLSRSGINSAGGLQETGNDLSDKISGENSPCGGQGL